MARDKTPKADKAPKEPKAPKKPNAFKQMLSVHKTVKTIDPKITLWMVAAALVAFLVVEGIGWLLGHPLISLVVAIPMALLAAMIVLARRGERAAYSQMEGQTGATAGALSALRRNWYYSQEPVAADAARPGDVQNAALVYRALGRPGIVLLAEGPRGRALKVLDKEKKRVARVAPGVPIHVVHVGSGKDEVPVAKVARTLMKLKPTLTKDEMAVVNKRLKSLPGVRSGIPAGVDPTRVRMDRKNLRGR
ncbi:MULTISPECIES: DUF4191 domain-containing protein [unclassified Janibacter]|uniref:DUF4191 domain-containing protein n=1 Tax=unclassified Janibacter TaxID=2649294 RepID=UPI003CFD5B9A